MVINVIEGLLIVSIAVVFLSVVFLQRYEYFTMQFYTHWRKAIQDYWAILILIISLVLLVVYHAYHNYMSRKMLDNSDAYRLYENPMNPGSPNICCGCVIEAPRRVDPLAAWIALYNHLTCNEASDPLISPPLDFMFSKQFL